MLKHYVKVFCILLSLLGSSCSLQDHTIPEPENPGTPDTGTPVTNEFKVSTSGFLSENGKLFLLGNVDKVDFTHQIDPKDNNEKAIVGFLVSSRVNNDIPINPDPRYDGDPSVRFYYVKDFVDYPSGYLETGPVKALEPFTFTEIYFRTVILLKDKVIYGNVFHRSGLSLPANPKPWEISTTKITGNKLGLILKKQGQIPAVELGFAVSYKEKDSDNIKKQPTVLDKRVLVDWKGDKGDFLRADADVGSGFYQKINFNFKEIYYRAYLILQDGSILYGDVMHEKK